MEDLRKFTKKQSGPHASPKSFRDKWQRRPPSSSTGTVPLRKRRAHTVIAAPSGKGLLCWRFKRRIHGVKRCQPWASKICNLDRPIAEHFEDAKGSHRRAGRTSGAQTHLLLPSPPRDERKHHHTLIQGQTPDMTPDNGTRTTPKTKSTNLSYSGASPCPLRPTIPAKPTSNRPGKRKTALKIL
jgi:hypothetical protein